MLIQIERCYSGASVAGEEAAASPKPYSLYFAFFLSRAHIHTPHTLALVSDN